MNNYTGRCIGIITDVHSLLVPTIACLEDLKDKGVVERRILEDSTGTIEIKDNKLYYYRNEIKETTLELPEVSIFEIGEDGYLTLTNNYLSKYQKEIILQ